MANQLTIEQMVDALQTNGWKKWHNHMTVWVQPVTGRLYRGPVLAWRVMEAQKLKLAYQQLAASVSGKLLYEKPRCNGRVLIAHGRKLGKGQG